MYIIYMRAYENGRRVIVVRRLLLLLLLAPLVKKAPYKLQCYVNAIGLKEANGSKTEKREVNLKGRTRDSFYGLLYGSCPAARCRLT